MKNLLIVTALLITTNCFASELHNFNEVKAAVTTGKKIHIVIDFLQCSAPNNERAEIMVVGVFTPNAIMIVNDHIATSLTHFTLNDPRFPAKPIYEYETYTITNKNYVTLTGQALDAVSYTPISDKFSFLCKINSGAKIYT